MSKEHEIAIAIIGIAFNVVLLIFVLRALARKMKERKKNRGWS